MSSRPPEQSKHELLEQHLNKAKKQVTIDTSNVASAKSMMDAAIAMYASAKSQLDMSKKEAEEAETMLAEAKKRDAVDNNDLEQTAAATAKKPEGSSNKRKKEEEVGEHAYDDETDKEDDSVSTAQANDQKKSTNSPQDNISKRRKVSVSPDSVKSKEWGDDTYCAKLEEVVVYKGSRGECTSESSQEIGERNGSVQKSDHMTHVLLRVVTAWQLIVVSVVDMGDINIAAKKDAQTKLRREEFVSNMERL